jgi:DNA-binding NarL/FixJ family response regulator
MARHCCLAGVDRADVPKFSAVFSAAGASALASLARLDVAELGRLSPDLLVCDLDGLDADRLEFLRQVRFVLPECTIGIYTGDMKRSWGMECHLAGANCLLSKDASQADLAAGVRDALDGGCFTDERFAL